MKLVVVAVGHRMPAWVDAGFDEYARRMPRDARLELIEVKPEAAAPAARSSACSRPKASAYSPPFPRGCLKVVLDERGTLLATAELARRIERWRARRRATSRSSSAAPTASRRA